MNKEDMEMTSVCGIVQNMFGSAGCKDPSFCYWCRFAHFRDAHNRVKDWVKEAQTIIGCLLTWADENDSEIAVDHPELYDLIVKARVLERAGSQAHAQCAHMQTLCTHEPTNEPVNSQDAKNQAISERCPRLNVPCELLGVCEKTLLPEDVGVCRAQTRGAGNPKSGNQTAPQPDHPRDVQIRELFDRVITLEHRLDAKCPSLDVKNPEQEPASKWRYET